MSSQRLILLALIILWPKTPQASTSSDCVPRTAKAITLKFGVKGNNYQSVNCVCLSGIRLLISRLADLKKEAY